MSLEGSYEEGNVFALILQGKLPSTKIYEDENIFSFLDIMPQSRGHALVISKWSKARNILEMEPEALSQVMAGVQKIAGAIRTALNPDGIQIMQFNGSDAGQTVFHLHVHIIPRWHGQAMAMHGGAPKADPAELADLAERIRAAF
jgi:histidine triad (HIT) family protein